MKADTARMEALAAATADLSPPFAVVDLDAFDRNAGSLVARCHGKPIRVASKSVRCRALVQRVLARDGFAGILAYTLAEALWLAEEHDDVVVAYPTADLPSLRALAGDTALAERVTLMVDSDDQLELARGALADVPSPPPLRVCLDLDASLRLAGGRLHLGMRRSPLHSVRDLKRFARVVVDDERFRLVGVMAYEGQIAGVPDNTGLLPRRAAVKGFQRLSAQELRLRRARAVAAVREVADLEFVNGGGTGSLESTSAEGAVTEVAAGSGLYAPSLFDGYSRFRLEPAAFFVLNVVRRPGPQHATVLGGGWVASGPAGHDRVPLPWWPSGLSLVTEEGAGEVQTPLTGPGARAMSLGDRVWFRHAKAGELCEHVAELHLVSHDAVVGCVPTYRGEGRAFA
jgi:D-serine deaminase-like pyridoxal phosphate-dependent protein